MGTSTLQVGSDALGGYLVPPEYQASIDKLTTIKSTILSLVRVHPARQRIVYLPKISALPELSWHHELGTKPLTDLNVDRDTLQVWEASGIVRWSDRLSAESLAAIEPLVRETLAEVAAQTIEVALWSDAAAPTAGSPASQAGPQGIIKTLVDAGRVYQWGTSWGANDDFVTSDLRQVISKIRAAGYEPDAIVMHPAAGAYCAGSMTTTGELRAANLMGPNPSIWGIPVRYSRGIPIGTDTAAESYVVVGAFRDAAVAATMPGSTLISNVATAGAVSSFETGSTMFRTTMNISSVCVRRTDAFLVISGCPTVG